MTAAVFAIVFLAAGISARIAWRAGRRRGLREGATAGYERGFECGFEDAAFSLKKVLGRERFLALLDELKERQAEQFFESRRPSSWRPKDQGSNSGKAGPTAGG